MDGFTTLSIATAPTSRGDQRVAAGIGCSMALLAACALAVSHINGPVQPAALATLVGAIIVFELLSAAMFYEQLWTSRIPALVPLATAYLCTGLLIIAYLLTFPNLMTPAGPFIGNEQAAFVFWCAWHTLLPLLVMVFAWSSRKPATVVWSAGVTSSMIVASVTFSGIATVITYAVAMHAIFPAPLIQHGIAAPVVSHVIGPAICALDLVSIAMLLATRLRTVVQLWLLVAMVAALFEAVTGVASFRYSLGWYISKVFALMSSGLLLTIFMFEITRLYRRLTAAQNELLQARDAALDGAKAKMQFLATMSHEIRTPINAIIGMNELLAQTPLDEEQREFAAVVHASADVLLSVINQVLDYSRLDAGKLKLDDVEFDPRVVCETTVDMIAGEAQAKGLAMAVFVDPSLPARMRGDEVRLRQVLMNLLSNAIKFTARGHIYVRAELESTSAESDVLRFTVSDTGIGIAPAMRKRLFSAFVQADASATRRFGGTGLGLSIAKRIVEKMHGTIGVESEEGAGARFFFTVRAHRVPSAVRQSPEREGRIEQRVLVVSAVPAVSDAITTYIRGWGATCRCETTFPANNGGGEIYGAVVVDLAGRSAAEVREAGVKLRQAFGAGTKVVGLVGYDLQLDRPTSAPFSAVLRAPVHRQALFAALRARSEEPPAAETAAAGYGAGRSWQKPLRVLVVDDNAMNCKLAVKQLAKLGIEADAVSDGALAVEAVAKQAYPVILMDCQMPNLDGYEATRRIRAREDGKARCTIIAMTAGTLPGDRQACLDVGMDDYLPKPVTLQALGAMLQTWIPAELTSHANAG
ncbi:MAG TPA: ATP-binding protein [Candidatus Acidoferrales bacterium]|nr:ATP-binding protein [Candidatus Acidoferrales bacterium]